MSQNQTDQVGAAFVQLRDEIQIVADDIGRERVGGTMPAGSARAEQLDLQADGVESVLAAVKALQAIWNRLFGEQRSADVEAVPEPAVGDIYFYENWVAKGHTAVIHKGGCSFCNYGQGRYRKTSTRNGAWSSAYLTVAEAKQAAEAKGAVVSTCAVCVRIAE